LGAVNSINWARILAQIVYYFSSYFRIRTLLAPHTDPEIVIQYAIPTGNFGDVLAAYYAKRMGLPMAKLVIATNSNDILTRFWRTGRYEKLGSAGVGAFHPSHPPVILTGVCNRFTQDGGVKETCSPAMDILISSNFERLLWYLAYEAAGQDAEDLRRKEAGATVNEWMNNVKQQGKMEVPAAVLELARRDFLADRVSDEQVCFASYGRRRRRVEYPQSSLRPSIQSVTMHHHTFSTRILPSVSPWHAVWRT
jgi:threonine synthase